jgi:hypothetical protein
LCFHPPSSPRQPWHGSAKRPLALLEGGGKSRAIWYDNFRQSTLQGQIEAAQRQNNFGFLFFFFHRVVQSPLENYTKRLFCR